MDQSMVVRDTDKIPAGRQGQRTRHIPSRRVERAPGPMWTRGKQGTADENYLWQWKTCRRIGWKWLRFVRHGSGTVAAARVNGIGISRRKSNTLGMGRRVSGAVAPEEQEAVLC